MKGILRLTEVGGRFLSAALISFRAL